MTIPTPTSNASGAGGYALPGLPDEAAMNRLAGEFFALAPDIARTVARFVPVAERASPLDVPVAAPARTDVPADLPAAGPIDPRQAPVIHAGALPQADGLQLPPSPFYFLSEAGAHPSSSQQLDGHTTPDKHVIAQSFGLPGQQDLQRLLGELYPVADGNGNTSLATVPGSNYYFLGSEQSYWDNAPRADHHGLIAHPPFDVNTIRRDFPILAERVNGRPLAWFDNAATTQKPQAVIDRLAYFYAHENSNIHRAAHELAARATDAYEAARDKVARFLGAGSASEIIFVRGATEGINLIAQTFGKQFIGAGDEIVVSQLEHHANIVPWQQLATEKGAKIRVIPVDDSGQILLDEYRKLLNDRTKLVSVTQVSNALGTVTPVKEIIDIAHRAGARVLIDGAQAVSHLRVNVQALDADFYVFSGHKVFGPTGIGAVYGKKALLEQLPPWQGGGNMIADVTFESTRYQDAPSRFEAGTGNIADAVGLGAALDYLERIGLENVARYEHALLDYATHGLQRIPGVRLIGTARDKASVASFVLAGYRPEEVGNALNQEGIAVRSGHHCAQPILRRFGVEATVRPSFAFYNTCEEIDRMLAVVRRLGSARK